jgi:hypothetical protein
MPHSSLRQIFIGLTAPFLSFQFLWKRKNLLLAGILPHIVNFIIYFWIIRNIFINKIIPSLINSLIKNGQHSTLVWILQSHFISLFIWTIAILLYGILGTTFVNAIASPIYDIITQSAFEETAQKKLPKQSFMDFVDSMISEFTKAVIIFSFFIISFFIQIIAPILFLIGLWYLGWNTIDRTLLLMNLSLKERIAFGLRNFALCIGLGIWNYIPVFSILIAFALAPAGAIAVAKTDKL